ncbi:EF-hand domain-containing protein [Pseudooceanicola sp.]|uniref:EF-hand domain-containing protein n=1 Tax=Pseudooceanicola sp. TaxID=1914328 RepID=UPI0035C6C80A
MTKTLTATIALLGLAATPLLAEVMVEDTDGNGSYSMEELAVAYPDLTEALFLEIDADASGEVTKEELTAAVDAGVIAQDS